MERLAINTTRGLVHFFGASNTPANVRQNRPGPHQQVWPLGTQPILAPGHTRRNRRAEARCRLKPAPHTEAFL